MIRRAGLKRSNKPLMRRTRLHSGAGVTKRGMIYDPEFLAFVHTEPCMIHGRNCPRWYGAIPNRLEAHHIDHNHRNDRRTVPMCRVAHGQRPFPSRETLEGEVRRLNVKYEAERNGGRHIQGHIVCADCVNGCHEVPLTGMIPCECPCHGERA